MVITIVHENFERVHTHSDAWTRMRRDAPSHAKVPGLILTYGLLGDDGIATGAVQVWRSRKDADAFFGAAGRDRGRRGGPAIEYFRVPVVVGEGYGAPEATTID